MTKRYTADDFANAKFAEHPDGRTARRIESERGTVFAWSMERAGGEEDYCADEHLAEHGWVPVPTKPTITDSEVGEIAEEESDDWLLGFISGFEKAGGEIIPDPEPTNTELIADALIDGFERDEFTLTSSFRVIAASLATRGITAPNVKDN